MAKPQYNYQHQKDRRNALALFVDGTLCPICRRPMRTWQYLDLNHVVPVAYGGTSGAKVLTHRYCNRAEGSRIRYGKRTRNGRIGKARINGSAINRDGTPRSGYRQLPKW